jgi:hypothetical protein
MLNAFWVGGFFHPPVLFLALRVRETDKVTQQNEKSAAREKFDASRLPLQLATLYIIPVAAIASCIAR